MDISKIAQFLQSAKDDYSQLGDAYPNAQKFAQALKSNVEQHIPSNQDFQSPEKMNNFALAAALNAPMGLMFVGPKSTGWNHEAANTATKLLDEGADPAQVWKENLIGRMPDKSLFSEIDDSGAKYIDNHEGGYSSGKADRAFKHNNLFEQYPLLKDIGIQHTAGPNGSLDMNSQKMTLGVNGDMSSIAAHEFQHAIQKMEGWARGGNPSEINLDEFLPLRQKEYNDIASVLLPETASRYKAATNQEEKDAIMAERKKLMLRQHQMTKQNPEAIQFELYKRLTGEAQARATQDRMNLNMQQRRESYPLSGDKLSDISLKDLINRYK